MKSAIESGIRELLLILLPFLLASGDLVGNYSGVYALSCGVVVQVRRGEGEEKRSSLFSAGRLKKTP